MLKSYLHKDLIEAGCDEAGRGCLAGPVYAAAVVLPAGFSHPDLNDSKKLSEKKRDILRKFIISNALSYGIASAGNREIDEINILNASYLAMHRALDRLSIQPEHILVDGNRFHPYKKIPYTTIVKGDAKYQSIAAASILAKTSRDDYMVSLHSEYPAYDWIHNKGYPTLKHRQAILREGVTDHHRQSFSLYPLQSRFDFKS